MAKNGRAASATAVTWLPEPEEHDYPAATSFLSLVFPRATVTRVVARLRAARIEQYKVKDIMRASGLALLPATDSDVARDLVKVRKKRSLSPVLLVQTPGRLVVADGYHRVCAVYHLDEDAEVACKLVGSS